MSAQRIGASLRDSGWRDVNVLAIKGRVHEPDSIARPTQSDRWRAEAFLVTAGGDFEEKRVLGAILMRWGRRVASLRTSLAVTC